MRPRSPALLLALLLLLSASPGPARAERRAPDFPSAAVTWVKRPYSASELWINSPPLDFKKLEGKVILVDFWEYTCINCIRTFDHLKRWDETYRPLGLVVVGVHAPAFDFAYDPANVRRAVERFGFKFPVAVDSNFRLWKAYGNTSWPSKYLVGKDRTVVYAQTGEGDYAEFERRIREALQEADPHVDFSRLGPVPEDKPGFGIGCGDMTKEVYLGAARNPQGRSFKNRPPEEGPEGVPFLRGPWTAEPDAQRAAEPDKDTFLGLTYRGAEIFAVMQAPEGARPSRVYVEQDGKPLEKARAHADVKFDEQGRSYIEVDEPRMYYVAKNPDGKLHEIRFLPVRAGLGVYSFTFGNRCLTDYSHL